MELFMRLAAYAHVGFIRGVDQAFYRLHSTNMSKSVTALMDLRQRRSVFEVVLERYGDRLADTDRLSDVVHRQLSREALWAAGRVYDRGRCGVRARPKTHGWWESGGRGGCRRAAGVRRRLLGRCGRHTALPHPERTQASRPPRHPVPAEPEGQWWLRRRSWKYRGF